MATILERGESFTIDKQNDLQQFKVFFGWKSVEDIDCFAFLLGKDGFITDDADFVFYNSETREIPFSREKFNNKRNWRSLTRPMSADGSVLGYLEKPEELEMLSDFHGESLMIDLNKVKPVITEIALCFSKYRGNNDDILNSHIREPFISIKHLDTLQEVCRYELNETIDSAMGVWAGSFLKDEGGNWSFKAIGQCFPHGIQSLINIFA